MTPDDSAPTAKDEHAKEPSSRPSEWSDEIWAEEIRNPCRLKKLTLEERHREAEIMTWRRPKQRGKRLVIDDVPRLRFAALLRDYGREYGGGGANT